VIRIPLTQARPAEQFNHKESLTKEPDLGQVLQRTRLVLQGYQSREEGFKKKIKSQAEEISRLKALL